jgi:hypothetical protein
MNKIKVQFSGGLGNQLFTYVAFKHIADKHDDQLFLDCSVVERVLGRPADILDFKLDDEVVVRQSQMSVLSDYANRISWKNKFTRKIFRRHLYPNLSDPFDYAASTRALVNRGFFQDREFFQMVSKVDAESWFSLKSESDRYLELREEMAKSEPIALHIRRGDYRDYKSSFGLLDTTYFEKATKMLLEIHGSRPVWVFSDEPMAIKEELLRSSLKISRYVKPDELSAAETLKLMSTAYAQVISNSTFSWWAGALSQGQRVVFPEPWFRKNDGWLSNSNLALTAWKELESSWLQ